jgi:iron(III) transport system substrate-binding protein
MAKNPVISTGARSAERRDLVCRGGGPSTSLRFARDDGVGRRALLKAAVLVTPLLPFGARVVSAAPPAEAVTPALVEAARKEGKVTYYTAMDLSVAEPLAKAFEAKYPGIKVAVERTGAERLFNRIAQENASNIRRADVVNSSDAAHFISWKRQGWLEPYVTVEIAENVPAAERDPDGSFTNQRTHLSAIAYNTSLIKPEDAPKGFNDLLDPKYAGKLVKGHPGYSGTIMTATHQIARELGWGYFEKLARQKVLQVQSATEPPKKIEAGERAVAADGSDYLFWMAKERGAPIEIVQAVEGTPQISNPMSVFKAAPNPNAARLMFAWIMSAEGQEFIVNLSGQYPANKRVKAKAGRPPLASIKTLREDPAEVEKMADEIKAKYARIFKV